MSNTLLPINVSVLPRRTHLELENDKTRLFMLYPVTRGGFLANQIAHSFGTLQYLTFSHYVCCTFVCLKRVEINSGRNVPFKLFLYVTLYTAHWQQLKTSLNVPSGRIH